MDIRALKLVLQFVGLSDERIDKYIDGYAETLGYAFVNSIFEILEKNKQEEIHKELCDAFKSASELYSSLMIADENKQRENKDRFAGILNKIQNIEQKEEIEKIFEARVDNIDKEVVDEIMNTLSDEKKRSLRKKIADLLDQVE